MNRSIALVLGIVVVMSIVSPQTAAAGDPANNPSCGGAGQWACWEWKCMKKIFGRCVFWLYLPSGSYDGCDNDRLNSYFGICGRCGSNWAPLCLHGDRCDEWHNNAGLCVPCGSVGEVMCWSGQACAFSPYRNANLFCTSYGRSYEPDCDCSVTTVPNQPPGEPLRGFADTHVHQFSNLGFGGAQFWGSPFHWDGINAALPWCDWTWDFVTVPGPLALWDLHLTLGFMAHGPWLHQEIECALGLSTSCHSYEGVHDSSGIGSFDGWPTWKTSTHQQMYHGWLERAYKGGLRLMVQLAVNNQVLCGMGRKRAGFTCDDVFSVKKQTAAAKQLEAYIDSQNGGPGRGWYRIVTSPSQAREVIESGKMAVVLGTEVDALFGCKRGSTDCTDEFIKEQVRELQCQGVRHVFPVHLFDNYFSGGALYEDQFTIGSFFNNGGRFIDPWDCSSDPFEEDQKYNYTTDWVNVMLTAYELIYGSLPFVPDWGAIDAHCNSRGLSTAGEVLVEEMMDLGMIIDVDHLSLLALEDVLTLAEDEDRSYPLVSGHAFIFDHPEMAWGNEARSENHKTKSQIHRIRDLGGIVAPLNPHGECSSTVSYLEKYEYIIEEMKGGPFGDEVLGVGFATDFGGMFQQTGPRFGSDACAASKYDAGEVPSAFPSLSYPFQAVGDFGWFWPQKMWLWEQREGESAARRLAQEYNFNYDGLAHVGLVPDFLADLRAMKPTVDLEPMMYSAEAYIRMWERVDDSIGVITPRVVSQVDGTRGANGWYISDVTVSWDATPPEAFLSLNGCDPVTIAADTTGTKLTCTAETDCGDLVTSEVVKRDTVPPAVTGARRLTPVPPNGWNKDPVVVEFEAMDATSGLMGESPVTVTVNDEGADIVAEHLFVDVAGNTTVAELGGINIDRTPPFIGFQFAHLSEDVTPEEYEAEVARWHNQDVIFNVVVIDEVSGVDSYSPEQLVLSAEGTAVQGSATATDLAGNSATTMSPALKIDKTPPVIEFVSRLPEANSHGWNNTDITVTWSCWDALSGAVESEISLVLSTEGGGQTLTGRCEDVAGNIAEHTVGDLNLDKTPPILICQAEPSELWPPNHKIVPVTVHIDFTDALSGPDESSLIMTSLSSSEPDSRHVQGDKPNDIQGFSLGASTTSGGLRAERLGQGEGRVYTLGYIGQDLAGNSATCGTVATVPHSQGQGG